MEHYRTRESFGAGTLGRPGGNGRWHSCRSFFRWRCDGRNAAQIRQVAGHFETVTVGAEGRQQSWGQCRAGSGQIIKEEAIGMRAEEFSDPPFVLSDERQKTLELLGQQFDS